MCDDEENNIWEGISDEDLLNIDLGILYIPFFFFFIRY